MPGGESVPLHRGRVRVVAKYSIGQARAHELREQASMVREQQGLSPPKITITNTFHQIGSGRRLQRGHTKIFGRLHVQVIWVRY